MDKIFDFELLKKHIIAEAREIWLKDLANAVLVHTTPDVLKSEDVAKMLGVSQNTVSNLVAKGELPNVSTHRNIRVRKSDVLRLKAEKEKNNGLILLLDRLK